MIFNATHQRSASATNLLGLDTISFTYEYYYLASDLSNVESTIDKGIYYAYVVDFTGDNSSNYVLPSSEIDAIYEIDALTLSTILTQTDFTSTQW